MPDRPAYKLFGGYRFALAMLVLISHSDMWLPPTVGELALGNVGVFSFFVLSGYVIAEALEIFYPKSPAKFAINRALKIYPLYWAAAAFAVFVMASIGHPYPINLTTLSTNLTIVFGELKFASGALFITPAWAIIIELVFYGLFAILWYASKGDLRLVALGGAAFLIFYGWIAATGTYNRWFSLFKHAPFFILGAGLYWAVSKRTIRAMVMPVLASVGSVLAFWIYDSADKNTYLFASTGAFLGSVMLLVILSLLPASPTVARVDRNLGEYTYALYLMHWTVISLVATFAISPGLKFVTAIAGSLVAAVTLSLIVERPIDHLRNLVRGRTLYEPK